MYRILLTAVFGLSTFALIGCGGSGRVSVSGIVTLDGQPFADADIMFSPIDGNGEVAVGSADSSGKFRMGSQGEGDGVMPGKYKVVINAVDRNAPRAGHPSEAFMKKAEEKPDAKIDGAKEYAKMQKEQAKAEKKKPKTIYADPKTTPFTVEIPKDRDLKLELTSDGK